MSKEKKTARRLLAVFVLAFIATTIFVGAASTFIEGASSRAWCLTGDWAKSKNLGEWVSIKGDSIVLPGTKACTTGWFTTTSNRIYIYGWGDGDTAAGKDSCYYSVRLEICYDTLFASLTSLDTFYEKDSTTRTVIFDSLDIPPSDSRGNAKVYGRVVITSWLSDTQKICLNGYSPNGLVNP